MVNNVYPEINPFAPRTKSRRVSSKEAAIKPMHKFVVRVPSIFYPFNNTFYVLLRERERERSRVARNITRNEVFQRVAQYSWTFGPQSGHVRSCKEARRAQRRKEGKIPGPAGSLSGILSILPRQEKRVSPSAQSGTRNNQSDLAIRNSPRLALGEKWKKLKKKKERKPKEGDLSRVGGHHLNQPLLPPRF